MKVRRLLVVALMSVPLVLLASPAGASPPVGKCPPPFQGPMTFAELIEEWPPPPDFPDPEGYLANIDINDDGRLCVKEVRTGINIIDNLVPVR